MDITTDASIFEITPKRVVYPESSDDLVSTVKNLLYKKKPFTMRAGGTSIGGQAIGSGTLIDVSKYLTNIISFSEKNREVVVEPGVIQDDLNDYLRPYNLKFAPDTSTSNRAMIGGMIGNNSCGVYSVYYGTTREHVKSIEVLLSDGSLVVFKELDELELKQKLQLQSLEGDIYRFIINTLNQNKIEILNAFPDKSLIRRNTGYAIDELIRKYQPFNPVGGKFNLASLICGSEGTLGVIIKATLKLVELPKHKSLIVAQFKSEEQALKIVDSLMQFKPAAVEFIDKPTLEVSKNNAEQKANRIWIKGNPEAVLVIEFFSNSKKDLNLSIVKCQKWLKLQKAYDCSEIIPKYYKKVWGIRKAGLGLLMGVPGPKKAIAVIEDAAIPLKYLYQYYKEVKKLIQSYNITAVYYGHASVGLIHIRPKLDLSIEKDKEIMNSVAYDVAMLVKKYQGSLSGEHGDGRIRAPYIQEQFGQTVYQLLVSLKNMFDPNNLLNPGVIIGNSSISSNLKKVGPPKENLASEYDWGKDISFFYASEKCNGAGACRKSIGRGIMCPSYKATRDEKFSTRGRANLLRRALHSDNPKEKLKSNELKEALNLCLACKACKRECPASVDMARLKSEYMYQTQSSQDQLILWYVNNLGKILKLGSLIPNMFNFLQNSKLIKKITGIDRNLPELHKETLNTWWKKNKSVSCNHDTTVWVACDLFTEYYDVQIGKDLLFFLKKCNVNIRLIPYKNSIIAMISQGLLPEAKNELKKMQSIFEKVPKNDFIIGIEPSEVMVWRDEAKNLIKGDIPTILLFEELLLKLHGLNALPKFNRFNSKVWVYEHCHQKSLAETSNLIKALELIPKLHTEIIHSGCCGMAGEFGYKNTKISEIIAHNSLDDYLKKIKDQDILIATGTSCRKQIFDIFKVQSTHLPSLFANSLKTCNVER